MQVTRQIKLLFFSSRRDRSVLQGCAGADTCMNLRITIRQLFANLAYRGPLARSHDKAGARRALHAPLVNLSEILLEMSNTVVGV